jgi:hypothetical protein
MQCSTRNRSRLGALEETMLINLMVNAYTGRVASVAELRHELAPFVSQQFREIWVSAGCEKRYECSEN